MRPHLWISSKKQGKGLWVLFFAMLFVGLVLDQLSPPGGWLALEFPALVEPAPGNAPASWTPGQREAVLFGLGLDFLYLIIYPLFLSLLCGRASQHWKLPGWLARTSLFFSGLVLFAMPLDALENFGLYFLIRGNSSEALQWFISCVSALMWSITLAACFVGAACIVSKLWPNKKEAGPA